MNDHDHDRDNAPSFDRRTFLAATSALGLYAMNDTAIAQQPAVKGAPDKRLRQMLAEFVVGFDLSKVPAEVVEHAREGFIDTIGVAIAGSHEEVSHLVAEMVKLEGSASQCTVIGTPLRVSPQLAALANGVVHPRYGLRPFVHERPIGGAGDPGAARSCRSQRRDARRCVGAVIIGSEVSARIQRSSPRLSNGGGWHTTGIVGGICAAAACAQAAKAAGRPGRKRHRHRRLARRRAAGQLRHHDQALHCGNSARNGLMAALLASKGFTSHAAVFEGNNGFFGSFSRALPVNYAPFSDLGRRWDIAEIGYRIKNYPCGGRGHTAIEAALMLREKIGAHRGRHQHPLLDVAGERQAHQHRLSHRRRGGEVLRCLRARLFARAWCAQDQGLHRGGAQGCAHARNGEAGDRRAAIRI